LFFFAPLLLLLLLLLLLRPAVYSYIYIYIYIHPTRRQSKNQKVQAVPPLSTWGSPRSPPHAVCTFFQCLRVAESTLTAL
jgi:hypothetical protein